MSRSRISHERYVSCNLAHLQRLADDTRYPVWQRVYFLAQTRLNRVGHCEFGVGDLAELLKVPANRISEALAKLRDMELITEESSNRCIVIPRDQVQQSWRGATDHCSIHGIEAGTVRLRRKS